MGMEMGLKKTFPLIFSGHHSSITFWFIINTKQWQRTTFV